MTLGNIAQMLDEQHKEAEALEQYRDLYNRSLATELPENVIARYTAPYAVRLVKLGRYTEAEAPLLETKKHFAAAKISRGSRYRELLEALAETMDKTNRPDEAARYRDELSRIQPTTATMPATQPRR
jgi:hypothetical protein